MQYHVYAMGEDKDNGNDVPLIFITFLDEGWCVTAQDLPSEEDGGCVRQPPTATFSEALESAIDLGEMLSGADIILSKSAAKVALREMRRRRGVKR